jgi:small subunit ribosomal protein S6e
MSTIFLKIIKKGESDVPNITDSERARRLGPKRANRIRKVFALEKADDVRKFVVVRKIVKGDKTFYKSPKIQRLITDKRIRRKRLNKKNKKDRFEAGKVAQTKYDKLLSNYIKDKNAKKDAEKAERRRSRSMSENK